MFALTSDLSSNAPTPFFLQAIVGGDSASSSFTDIVTTTWSKDVPSYGIYRRRAILGLQDEIRRRLEASSHPLPDLQAEADRLIFHYAVHWKCFPVGDAKWHHRESAVLVQQGLELLEKAPLLWSSREPVVRMLHQCVVSCNESVQDEDVF